MRQILFRGQKVDTKEWVEGAVFNGNQGTYILIKKIEDDKVGLNYFHPIEVIPETVGQFTGLKDINGVNIFEGDAIVSKNESVEKYMIVGWSKKFASFILNRVGWMYSHWFGESCDPENCTIIGNIHDNPELLNK